MKRLENLPDITDEMLGGLKASEALRSEILQDARLAAQGKKVTRNTPWQKGPARKKSPAFPLRVIAAAACVLLIAAGGIWGIPNLLGNSTVGSENPVETLIDTQTAGYSTASANTQLLALDVPRNSIVISQKSQPSYRGVWESASSANFPLICVNGRYYRLMSNPSSIGSDLVDASLGTVNTYTNEPALASGGIVSNILPEGETVYAVRGMGNAAVAADINGTKRVFQRVSFGSSALTGGESLADTLGYSAVTALELTNVGTVTDSAQAQALFNILVQNARMTRTNASETAQSLLIALQNGLVLQMSVRDESLMACGTWSCPEFFEAFEAAVQ